MDTLEALKAKRSESHHPDEVVAMLDAVPDLRQPDLADDWDRPEGRSQRLPT